MIYCFVDIQVLWSQMQNVEIYLDFWTVKLHSPPWQGLPLVLQLLSKIFIVLVWNIFGSAGLSVTSQLAPNFLAPFYANWSRNSIVPHRSHATQPYARHWEIHINLIL